MHEEEYVEVDESELEVVEYIFEETGVDFTGVDYVTEGQ